MNLIRQRLGSKLNVRLLKKIPALLAKNSPLIFPALLIFFVIHSYPFTIDGDGLSHIIVSRWTAETGVLPQHHPYLATDVTSSGLMYLPIDYPILSYLIGAVFWKVGGLEGMKLMPVISALATAIVSYLLFSKVSRRVAPFVAGTMVVVNLRTFIQPVLIEQLLLPVSLVAIYSYAKSSFLNNDGSRKWTLISGLFLGLAAALKQQGMVLFFAIFLHATLLLFYRSIRKETLGIRNYFILFLVGILTCAPFLYELALRNGTPLGYEPFPDIVRYLPFLKSKYQIDLESLAYYQSILGNVVSYRSVFDPALGFLLYPIFFEASHPFFEALWVPFSFVLVVGGLILIYSRNKSMSTLLVILMLSEILTAYRFNDSVQQYHQLGLSITVLLISSGFVFLFRSIETISTGVNLTLNVTDGKILMWSLSLKKRFKLLVVMLLTSSLLISTIVSALSLYASVVEPAWGAKIGRLNHQNINQYSQLGTFVQEKIPKNAITFGAESGFMYYGCRTLIWPTWYGGGELPRIWAAKTSEEALRWLEHYNVDFIFIDRRQLNWSGLSDWVQSDGLILFIDSSIFFRKIYESDDGILQIYQVDYDVQPFVLWNSTAFTQNWTYAYSRNLFFNETETSRKNLNIFVQGSGVSGQYVRYEKRLYPIVTNGDEYMILSWARSSAYIELAAELRLNGEITFVVSFPEGIIGNMTTIVALPAKIELDTISVKTSIKDNSYESGQVQFDSVIIQRGK